MMKPFAMRELKARCRALVRRQDGGAAAALRRPGTEPPAAVARMRSGVDCAEPPRVRSAGIPDAESRPLRFPRDAAGACLEREEAANTNVVDVYINYLRRKLGPSASLIETVRGQGYRIAGLESSRQAGAAVPLPHAAGSGIPAAGRSTEPHSRITDK